MIELILRECIEKAQAESNLAKPETDNDMKIELSEEFLMKLRSNAYCKTYDEDVADHNAKVLEILDLIKTPNVDIYHLCMKEELVENFFCKFYPLSRDGEDKVVRNDDNSGHDPFEIITRVNSKFKYHKKADEGTKKSLLYSWIDGSWNKEPMDDIISSDEEWEDSDYGNPSDMDTDSFSDLIWMLMKK
uniref:Uncharacterized protein n=1 Tax=Tanacetum cinerariifolium TaxID=118510 RepID=A0A699H3U0_TANCI|nr:hypothetical protein [Tanacetum cinerariifolium]